MARVGVLVTLLALAACASADWACKVTDSKNFKVECGKHAWDLSGIGAL